MNKVKQGTKCVTSTPLEVLPAPKDSCLHRMCHLLPQISLTWASDCRGTHGSDGFYPVPVSTPLVFLSGVMILHWIKMQHLLLNIILAALHAPHHFCNQWLSCICHYLGISPWLLCASRMTKSPHDATSLQQFESVLADESILWSFRETYSKNRVWVDELHQKLFVPYLVFVRRVFISSFLLS